MKPIKCVKHAQIYREVFDLVSKNRGITGPKIKEYIDVVYPDESPSKSRTASVVRQMVVNGVLYCRMFTENTKSVNQYSVTPWESGMQRASPKRSMSIAKMIKGTPIVPPAPIPAPTPAPVYAQAVLPLPEPVPVARVEETTFSFSTPPGGELHMIVKVGKVEYPIALPHLRAVRDTLDGALKLFGFTR
jgi:hypothetical protein